MVELRGSWSGVSWEIEDGMISVKLRPEDVGPLVEELRRHIRVMTSSEIPTPSQFDSVNRASRICWEALETGSISSLDGRDCDVLYAVRQEPGTEWVFKVLNRVRQLLRRASTTPVTADSYAKQVSAVMES